MKMLVMGGTRFNGLHLVQELIRYGHAVTILNRGVTETSVSQEVRRLFADRKDHKLLQHVLGREAFDVIFDISAYTFEAPVQQTYERFMLHGLDKQREYHFL